MERDVEKIKCFDSALDSRNSAFNCFLKGLLWLELEKQSGETMTMKTKTLTSNNSLTLQVSPVFNRQEHQYIFYFF